ncbi:MAG TPA: XRE family transcriptional regulator [Ktedonobacteraceae bacterium]|nr:XRE family transcriptional regulator [Ktedonobacteraceae bacterium]
MDNNILETIDMKTLGKELQQARTKIGMTQEEAAKIIGVARTTMINIEQGGRRIRGDELLKLAIAYGIPVSDFVRPRPILEMSKPQFRGPTLKSEEDTALIEQYVEQLKQLARDYFELEEITETPLVRKYPPEYVIGKLRTHEAAENIASQERMRLGLGDGPVPLLRDILEQDVGIRIFYYPFPGKFSAIYLYDEQVGGCIAVNKNHPEERRRHSLAHDYAHFLTVRNKPEVFIEEGYYQRKPESERLADNFATAFLMPAQGVTRRFNDLRATKGSNPTVGDLCVLAHYYGVSVEAMTLRLEELRLLSTGVWEHIERSKFSIREAQRQLGLDAIPARDQKFALRYQHLAIEAFNRGLISEGILARFLEVDRLEARHIAELLQPTVEEGTNGSLSQGLDGSRGEGSK